MSVHYKTGGNTRIYSQFLLLFVAAAGVCAFALSIAFLGITRCSRGLFSRIGTSNRASIIERSQAFRVDVVIVVTFVGIVVVVIIAVVIFAASNLLVILILILRFLPRRRSRFGRRSTGAIC